MRDKINIDGEEQAAIFTTTAGVRFYVCIEDDQLWVHADAPEDDRRLGVAIDYEANAGNEGWLKPRFLAPIPQQKFRKIGDRYVPV